ncbi:MAG TPA: aminotransferase class IV [Candidatus Acidoferrales bacterium]|nr:aminotransferase class IV [Candidatus Acidoferrales bacterium]
MIHRLVFHNDGLLPVEQVRLSPGQSGLLSGWGLFTTMRIVEGVPFAFERHWKRLERDAEKTRCPFPFDKETVRGQLAEVLRANEVREGCARIYVISNQIGFWRSDEKFLAADLVITSSGLPSYRDPLRLALREQGRHAASPLAGVKVTSWLPNVWSLSEAQRDGYDEVILLNERGEIAECTAANVFCAKDARVFTPPLSSGCLAGITREVVMEIGSGKGVTIEERTLFPDDLYSADEVFISSTNRSMLNVSEIAGRKLAIPREPIARKLEKIFNEYVRAYVRAHSVAAVRS